MNTTLLKNTKKLTALSKTLAVLIAVVSAVALPQLLHTIGAVTGLGTALGEALLPMHLPVMLVGLLAGPVAGAITGFLSPLISFSLTQMPSTIILPFMIIELCIYGITAGLLRATKMPSVFKVLLIQLSGRIIRAAAIIIATYGFAYTAVPIAIIWKSVTIGTAGIIIQLALLPVLVKVFSKKSL